MAEYDLNQIISEIQAEVEGQRAAGTLPTGLERELDEIFAQLAPTGAASGNIEGQLLRIEEASHLDLNPPVESSVPGGEYIKRAERRVLAWYMSHVANQFAELGGSAIRALRSLAKRLDDLETVVLDPEETSVALARFPVPSPRVDEFEARLVEELRRANPAPESAVAPRVLHAESGDGALLHRLAAAGIDAYGVDPVAARVLDLTTAELDVRQDTALDHLVKLGDGVLGSVVLMGTVDTEPVAAKARTVELALAKTRAGGRVAIVTADLAKWRESADVAVDLAEGEPLRPAAWAYLLEEHGAIDIEVLGSTESHLVLATKPES